MSLNLPISTFDACLVLADPNEGIVVVERTGPGLQLPMSSVVSGFVLTDTEEVVNVIGSEPGGEPIIVTEGGLMIEPESP